LLLGGGMLAGCLNQLVPSHQASASSGDEVEGLPVVDMGYTYGKDPTTDAGAPVKYATIQAQMDTLGCTTATCHGATQVPVIIAKPTANQALLNYFDLLSGCANGAPDPSDCIDRQHASTSLLLAKTCASSGVTHMGGSVFKDDTDPTYQLWQGWIAAGAPY
jgi:hypothetical protein